MARDKSMNRNYSEYKWTKEDKEREARENPGLTQEQINTRANKQNRDLDNRQRQLRYELKDNSMQPGRQKAYNDPGYAREEAVFNKSNKREKAYNDPGYAREEAAFNKGRNPTKDRLDNLNRKGQYMRDKMSENVPSTRPGESGREWGDHKYIDKVETKTGKIRYIYDIDTSSGHHSSDSRRINNKDLNRARDELNKAKNSLTRPTNPKAILKETERKANDRNRGGGDKLHDPISEISRAARDAGRLANSAVKKASKAVSDGAKYVSDALSDIAKNTPLKDIFK